MSASTKTFIYSLKKVVYFFFHLKEIGFVWLEGQINPALGY